MEELAFDSLTQARDFLDAHGGGVFANPNEPDKRRTLDCKAASPRLAQAYEEKYSRNRLKGAV